MVRKLPWASIYLLTTTICFYACIWQMHWSEGIFGSLCSLALFLSLPVGICEFRQAPIRRRWCYCVAPKGSRCPTGRQSLSSENKSLKAWRGSFEQVNWSHLTGAHKSHKRHFFFVLYKTLCVRLLIVYEATALRTFFAWPFLKNIYI